jgi:hypothetical protein
MLFLKFGANMRAQSQTMPQLSVPAEMTMEEIWQFHVHHMSEAAEDGMESWKAH